MTHVVTLIQARMSSSRLPGKVLLPLGGKTVLDQVIARASAFSLQVVVCTSTDASDDPIEAHCARAGVTCARGALDDVFSRFRDALSGVQVARTEWFARVTADCPLVSPTLARACIAAATREDDYVGALSSAVPVGIAIELVRRAAFLAIDPVTLDPPEREHVTLRLYEHPGRYRVRRVAPPPSLFAPEMRLTLDYPEDYALLTTLFERDPDLDAERAIERLRSEPALAQINAACAQRNARPAPV